jgi:hypothetical protein
MVLKLAKQKMRARALGQILNLEKIVREGEAARSAGALFPFLTPANPAPALSSLRWSAPR